MVPMSRMSACFCESENASFGMATSPPMESMSCLMMSASCSVICSSLMSFVIIFGAMISMLFGSQPMCCIICRASSSVDTVMKCGL